MRPPPRRGAPLGPPPWTPEPPPIAYSPARDDRRGRCPAPGRSAKASARQGKGVQAGGVRAPPQSAPSPSSRAPPRRPGEGAHPAQGGATERPRSRGNPPPCLQKAPSPQGRACKPQRKCSNSWEDLLPPQDQSAHFTDGETETQRRGAPGQDPAPQQHRILLSPYSGSRAPVSGKACSQGVRGKQLSILPP